MRTQPNDSHIELKDGKISGYIGPDATHLLQAKMLASSIKLWVKCKMIPTRGVTITSMLAMACEFSGKKKYKTSQAMEAYDDIIKWALTMEQALPHKVDGEEQ